MPFSSSRSVLVIAPCVRLKRGTHDSWKTNAGAAGSAFGRRVRSDHHDHGAGTQAAFAAVLRDTFAPLAYGTKLHGELSLHRDCLGEPSSSAAICGACNATADLVELRAPLRGIAGAILYCMDCGHTLSRGSCGCVCCDTCDGEFSLPPIGIVTLHDVLRLQNQLWDAASQ